MMKLPARERSAVAESLAKQGISFKGPGVTPGGNHIYVVEGRIFTEAELGELLARGELNREGIGKLLESIHKE